MAVLASSFGDAGLETHSRNLTRNNYVGSLVLLTARNYALFENRHFLQPFDQGLNISKITNFSSESIPKPDAFSMQNRMLLTH